MRLAKYLKIIPLFSLCVLLLNLSPVALSTPVIFGAAPDSSTVVSSSAFLLLADAEILNLDNKKPRSGSLVLPVAVDEEKSEKKCMTVCQRWGQECMIDSTRGVRKCRRTCKEFGQECF